MPLSNTQKFDIVPFRKMTDGMLGGQSSKKPTVNTKSNEPVIFFAHNKIYAAYPNGAMSISDLEKHKKTTWLDKNKNGKYDLKTVAIYDSHGGCKTVTSKLGEKNNDIKSMQRSLLAKLKNEDTKYKKQETAHEKSLININGKIEKFSQGGAGDCWLLSSIEALAGTTNGAKAIKNAISQDKDGNVIVKLVGAKEAYKFSPHDILQAKYRLSHGDDDVRAIELAVEKHREKVLKNEHSIVDYDLYRSLGVESGRKKEMLYGGLENEAFLLLMAKESKIYFTPKLNLFDKAVIATSSRLKSEFKDIDISTGLGLKQMKANRYAMTATFESEKGHMVPEHGYVVKSVDNKQVTVVNPWDTSIKIIIPRNVFVNNCKYITSCDMGEN